MSKTSKSASHLVQLMLPVAVLSGCGLRSETIWSKAEAPAVVAVQTEPRPLPSPIVLNSESEPLFPAVEVPNAPEVNRFVREYNTDRKSSLRVALERRRMYAATVRDVFERHGLPQELIHVAMVESAFQPQARSGRGAVGMWQFIAGTARRYGLTIGGGIDERKDVRKATDAAARHLVDLYRSFNDWALVLAAYNSGEGTVNRAIAKSGKRSFFELARMGYFPRETVDYVSRFMALALIYRDVHPYLGIEDSSIQLARADDGVTGTR